MGYFTHMYSIKPFDLGMHMSLLLVRECQSVGGTLCLQIGVFQAEWQKLFELP